MRVSLDLRKKLPRRQLFRREVSEWNEYEEVIMEERAFVTFEAFPDVFIVWDVTEISIFPSFNIFFLFQDEVLAISEKVVIRVEDLITWIIVEAEWTWGRLAKCEEELKEVEVDVSKSAPPRKPTGTSFTLSDSTLDFSDVENERKTLGESKSPTCSKLMKFL